MGEKRSAVAQLDLASGTMLGKYEVLRKLATGGMAEIYLARVRGNAGFEKLVVIKRILPSVADDPNFVRMFLDEARLAATLQHPNIADVHEVGEHEGSPYFVMQFVHGQDVRAIRYAARQHKESVPLAIALAIVHGTASALDYAHDRCGPDGKNLGIVHRDVSSSNILVSYEGAIKLIDFGIARAKSHSQQTQVGMLKGKIPYMSPEQCRGHALDRRSDLFSLGVVMYELTAGRRPFQGESDFAIMEQIVHKTAAPPSSLMRNYPPELEAIVMRLLAPKLEDRYQTGEAMLHDLDPFLAQHRLWVSPKPLSRYMRAQFSDAMSAWDKAVEDGVTLAQFVASTSTAPSQRSMLVTPPSAFPAVMPLSQEMPAVRLTGNLLAGTARDIDSSTQDGDEDAPRSTREPEPLPVAIAAPARRGSGMRAAIVALGVIALGGGGYAGYSALNRAGSSAAAGAASAPMPEVRDTVVMPSEPATSPPAAPVEPAATEPAATEPAATTTQTETETETETRPPPTRPAPPRPAPTTAPSRPRPPPKDTPPTAEPRPPKPPRTGEPPATTAPKDQKKWDLDSPFLPN